MEKLNPRLLVSIIVPCYNTGVFLPEALQSVFDSGFDRYEVLVVNDGSSEFETLDILSSLKHPKVEIVHQENEGLAAARNYGVSLSKGEILLFLDSDNRVRPEYFELAIPIFESDKSVGVVYGLPHFFGETNNHIPRFNTRPYSFDALLAGNYIDACSFVRRSTFEEVGGFHIHPDLMGWDDADLWIRISLTSWKFHFLNSIVFDYRVREDSMMGKVDSDKRERMLKYLGAKHGFVIHQRYRQYFRVMDQIQKNPFSYFLRILYYKYIKRQPFIK